MKKGLTTLSIILLFLLITNIGLLQLARAADTTSSVDWPIWVYPTSTGGDDTISYIGPDTDTWLTESWFVPVDYIGGPKTETLDLTIQNRKPGETAQQIRLVVALNPAAYVTISQVDVSPSIEGSATYDQFTLCDSAMPEGIDRGQPHIYKDADIHPPSEWCYFYEFNVANSLAPLDNKNPTDPANHIDLTVTLHIKEGIISSEGIYVHFDCSVYDTAKERRDFGPWSHDVNTYSRPPPPVIPEVPIGSIAAAASMIIAFGAYFGIRRRRIYAP